MDIRKTPIFRSHKDAPECFRQIKQRRLYAGLLILGAIAAWLGLRAIEVKTGLTRAEGLAILLPGLVMAGGCMVSGYALLLLPSRLETRTRLKITMLAQMLGITVEELCIKEPEGIRAMGKRALINKAANLQIFDEDTNKLKVLLNEIPHQTRRKCERWIECAKHEEMSEISQLHELLIEFGLSKPEDLNRAFREADKTLPDKY